MFWLIYVHVILCTWKLLYVHVVYTLVTMHAICQALCVDGTTLYSRCDWASDMLQQLELAFVLESDLQDTSNLIFRQLQLIWFRLTGLILVLLMVESIFDEKSSIKMLGFLIFFSLKGLQLFLRDRMWVFISLNGFQASLIISSRYFNILIF